MMLGRRWLVLYVAAAAAVLIAAGPAAALAAGEEVVAESGPTTEPAPEVGAGSNGWIPQGSETEAPSEGPAPTRHGTSLGSGAVPSRGGSSSEAPSNDSGSSGYLEPESPAPESSVSATAEAAASPPRPDGQTPPLKPRARKVVPDKNLSVALGTASVVARPEPPAAARAPQVKATPVAIRSDSVPSVREILRWLALAACGLAFVFGAAQMVRSLVTPSRR